MSLSIRSPDELIAAIPHMLGFKLFWTTLPAVLRARVHGEDSERRSGDLMRWSLEFLAPARQCSGIILGRLFPMVLSVASAR